ncbi:MAG: hypothetical protein BalsKO_12970 [Balneolaceae bacterium]
MNWIKDALLDVLIIGVIIVNLITSNNTIEIVIWVYTSLLIISKILYFFVDFLQSKASKTSVPDWFYHITYFLSITLFILSKNYYLSVAWLLIWILSVIPNFVKSKKATT